MLLHETLVDAYHGYFDDIGGTALDRSVDSITFGISTYYGIV